RAGHAVGAEHRQRALRHLGQLLDEDRAFGLQAVDHMLVVDDLMPDIDGPPVLLESSIDDVDRPDDARAETARLSQHDSHDMLPSRGPRATSRTTIRHIFAASAKLLPLCS